MSDLGRKIKAEFEELLPPTIFFFVALHLVAIIRNLFLEGTGIAPGTSVSITIAALILAKAVLIADLLPFINRYPDKPLAYNVAWKTAIYVVIAMFLHYLERLIDFWRANRASYKKPLQIVFVPALPKSPTGKLLRRALRAMPST